MYQYYLGKEEMEGLRGLGLYSQKIVMKTSRDSGREKVPELEFEINNLGRKLATCMYYDLQDAEFISYVDNQKQIIGSSQRFNSFKN